MAVIKWNPADKHANVVLSNSNLTACANATVWKSVRNIGYRSSGKFYWEYYVNNTDANFILGVGTESATIASYVGSDAYGWGFRSNATKFHSAGSSSYGATYTSGDIIGNAVDMDSGKIWWSKNGVWLASGDPVAGTNEAYSGLSGNMYPMASPYSATNMVTLNTSPVYAPPNGFKFFGFTGYFTGYVYELGSPVSRTLYVHNRSTGVVMNSTTSSGNGYYYVETTYSGAHYIVCLDDEAGTIYNDLIIGNVTPTALT